MSQKSPVPQAVSFVSQVLKRDNLLVTSPWSKCRYSLRASFPLKVLETVRFRRSDSLGNVVSDILSWRLTTGCGIDRQRGRSAHTDEPTQVSAGAR